MQDKREKRFLLFFDTCTETPWALTELSQPFIAILIFQSSLTFLALNYSDCTQSFQYYTLQTKGSCKLRVDAGGEDCGL